MPSNERKQVEPDPAKPLKDDTGRGIILRIIRGGTPVLEPDQHPIDPLILRLVGHRTSPHRHGVVHVRSPWRRLPSGPETEPPRGDQELPGFLNGLTAKVTMFTTIQGIGCGRNGDLAGMRWRRRRGLANASESSRRECTTSRSGPSNAWRRPPACSEWICWNDDWRHPWLIAHLFRSRRCPSHCSGDGQGDGDHGRVRARQSRDRMEAHGSHRSEVDACDR